MNIYGYNKTTLLDYPEHVAATVFTGGCNFRCPYCHNSGLVLVTGEQEKIAEEEVFSHLKKRQGLLEGVCITGGEPTLQPDLIAFVRKVKAIGYLVKLDTNGSHPEVLRQLLALGLLDYIAMDIKASRENYACAVGLELPDLVRIEESIAIIKNSGIPYEFRTTVVKGIHSVEEFDSIGKWLAGSCAYYLQAYQENENVLALNEEWEKTLGYQSGERRRLSSFSRMEMEQMAAMAGKYITKVALRGIE